MSGGRWLSSRGVLRGGERPSGAGAPGSGVGGGVGDDTLASLRRRTSAALEAERERAQISRGGREAWGAERGGGSGERLANLGGGGERGGAAAAAHAHDAPDAATTSTHAAHTSPPAAAVAAAAACRRGCHAAAGVPWLCEAPPGIVCCGDNRRGQLGIGDGTARVVTPVMMRVRVGEGEGGVSGRGGRGEAPGGGGSDLGAALPPPALLAPARGCRGESWAIACGASHSVVLRVIHAPLGHSGRPLSSGRPAHRPPSCPEGQSCCGRPGAVACGGMVGAAADGGASAPLTSPTAHPPTAAPLHLFLACGANDAGQLGVGDTRDRRELTSVLGSLAWPMPPISGSPILGLSPLLAQHGSVASEDVSRDDPVPSDLFRERVVQIGCGADFTVALTAGGRVYACGNTAGGRSANGHEGGSGGGVGGGSCGDGGGSGVCACRPSASVGCGNATHAVTSVAPTPARVPPTSSPNLCVRMRQIDWAPPAQVEPRLAKPVALSCAAAWGDSVAVWESIPEGGAPGEGTRAGSAARADAGGHDSVGGGHDPMRGLHLVRADGVQFKTPSQLANERCAPPPPHPDPTPLPSATLHAAADSPLPHRYLPPPAAIPRGARLSVACGAGHVVALLFPLASLLQGNALGHTAEGVASEVEAGGGEAWGEETLEGEALGREGFEEGASSEEDAIRGTLGQAMGVGEEEESWAAWEALGKVVEAMGRGGGEGMGQGRGGDRRGDAPGMESSVAGTSPPLASNSPPALDRDYREGTLAHARSPVPLPLPSSPTRTSSAPPAAPSPAWRLWNIRPSPAAQAASTSGEACISGNVATSGDTAISRAAVSCSAATPGVSPTSGAHPAIPNALPARTSGHPLEASPTHLSSATHSPPPPAPSSPPAAPLHPQLSYVQHAVTLAIEAARREALRDEAATRRAAETMLAHARREAAAAARDAGIARAEPGAISGLEEEELLQLEGELQASLRRVQARLARLRQAEELRCPVCLGERAIQRHIAQRPAEPLPRSPPLPPHPSHLLLMALSFVIQPVPCAPNDQ